MTIAAPAAQLPWIDCEPVPPADFARLHAEAIFDCCKWDPQVGDVSTLAPFPIVLKKSAWQELAALAGQLATEALAAEAAMVDDQAAHRTLSLPPPIIKALRSDRRRPPAQAIARLIRFDFHFTPGGWIISEANSDVPGGMNEASGFTQLMARHYPQFDCPPDPVQALAEAVIRRCGSTARVGLAHATAYSDDCQVMTYMARRWRQLGIDARLMAPDHLRWRDDRAELLTSNGSVPLDCLFRFFPAEWLPGLPRASQWQRFFRGSATPLCNPATALLTQSKRFPLCWDALRLQMPTWRRLLPETVDPAALNGRGGADWILKPIFGRVGDGIGIEGVTPAGEMADIRLAARRDSRHWIAQRRFQAVPFMRGDQQLYPCIGIYTVDGVAVGAYARIAARPLIDQHAQEAAVLIQRGDGQNPKDTEH
jgi:glutathionylspermidine synthase